MSSIVIPDTPHDFEVRYRFLSADEGGRDSGAPFQGYRCDWAYDGDDITKTGIYMIWPFFEDAQGNVFEEKVRVPVEGIARMWIVNKDLKDVVHRKRIKPGLKGFFMEDEKRVAEAEVTRIVGLNESET